MSHSACLAKVVKLRGVLLIQRLSAKDGKAVVHGTGEVAFLDVREAGPYSEGHPLFATHCPFSLLEARVGDLVPRSSVPVLLIDGGDGIADVAANILKGMGYLDVAVVIGGTPEWGPAGFTLYQGVNVPSKTLGELVEHTWRLRLLDPKTLAKWQAEGQRHEFYDCRPASEYAKMTVPGAESFPIGELAQSLPTLDRESPIVLTCAGRTRGAIGAASITRLDPGREVYALENGTQGWRLAGYDLSFDNVPELVGSSIEADAALTRQKAAEFMATENIESVEAPAVSAMLENAERTTYLLDVRPEALVAQDPLAAFTPALSGQVVQATDQWIGVRRARVVLADDLGMRAALTAFWLRAMGFEAYVAEVNDDLHAIPQIARPQPRGAKIETCPPEIALQAVSDRQGLFLDVRSSAAYATEHVPGSIWCIRPMLADVATGMQSFVIGDGGPRAELAVQELLRLGCGDAAIVKGGHAALIRAGARSETTAPMALSRAIDVTSFAHGRHDGDLAASRLYLDWEMGLVQQLDENERAEFIL